jgi:hypothetical protein
MLISYFVLKILWVSLFSIVDNYKLLSTNVDNAENHEINVDKCVKSMWISVEKKRFTKTISFLLL